MIELAGYRPGEDIEIKFTGLRPGEKLYEEVLSDKENTIPTENKKIMIAKVRHYEYADILDTYAEFEKLSRTVKIMDTVRLMKKVVPEFKSKNSPRFFRSIHAPSMLIRQEKFRSTNWEISISSWIHRQQSSQAMNFCTHPEMTSLLF